LHVEPETPIPLVRVEGVFDLALRTHSNHAAGAKLRLARRGGPSGSTADVRHPAPKPAVGERVEDRQEAVPHEISHAHIARREVPEVEARVPPVAPPDFNGGGTELGC